MSSLEQFRGASMALVGEDAYLESQVVAIRRSLGNIAFAGKVEFPGGGRERHETEEECALRELYEEVNIARSGIDIVWKARYPMRHDPSLYNTFFVAKADLRVIQRDMRLGGEGQECFLRSIPDILEQTDIIPQHQDHFMEFLLQNESQIVFEQQYRVA